MLEIACDESGYEGEKLIGTTTDVFAHASVRLDPVTAAACLRELRARIRSPALEYKANHLLREKHRAVLRWLLGPAAPLSGRAYVYLVDKAYLVLLRVVALLVPDQPAEPLAATLYRASRAESGGEAWQAFLAAANQLLRTHEPDQLAAPVDAFTGALDTLRRAGPPEPAGALLETLHWAARPRATAFRERLRADPRAVPTLDPLVPAIERAVAGWGAEGEPVEIVHDRQKTLSPDRIARLADLLGPRLAGLRFVVARSDARVQVADILAGVVRKLATDELHERADPLLTRLLRPYLDPRSIWGDERSWSQLAPPDPGPRVSPR